MKVAVLAGVGIGGTEKAAVGYAAYLARHGAKVWYFAADGPRTATLQKAGVETVDLGSRAQSLAAFLRETRPDILHQHVPGYPIGTGSYPVLRELGAEAPRLIETNVFGRLEDPEGQPFVRHRLFISQASAVQAFRRANRPLHRESLAHSTVVYYPVESSDPLPDSNRETLRAELGVAPDEILAIRVGQPSVAKWRDWEARALLLARRRHPQLRLLLMQPPPWIQEWVEKLGPRSGILIRPTTADFDHLQRLYSAADVMLHASNFGESFGYTLAEGMEAGLPLIVRSTPWGDNAQVELVDNGRTGFVCASVPEMARRLGQLATDPPLRRQFGEAGRRRIRNLANPDEEGRTLLAVIEAVLSGSRSARLDERRESLLAFAREFDSRERTFSETLGSRPAEALHWSTYRSYRRARSTVRGWPVVKRLIGR